MPQPGIFKAAAQHASPLPATAIGADRQAKGMKACELPESLHEVEILH